MKTAKGNTYTTLLNVKIEDGDLYLHVRVPMELGNIDHDFIEKMIPVLNDTMMSGKKPSNTYEGCLSRIEHHRDQLRDAYVKLFETYMRAITPQTRTSPIDKARAGMLSAMDDKMLKQFATLQNVDLSDVILPDDRETLIDSIIAAMKKGEQNGKE